MVAMLAAGFLVLTLYRAQGRIRGQKRIAMEACGFDAGPGDLSGACFFFWVTEGVILAAGLATATFLVPG